MKVKTFIASLILVTLNINAAIAADPAKQNNNAHAIALTPSDLKWTNGPDSLPPNAQMAVLEGDPSKSGPFTIRIKFPAGYKIPPHWHPAVEHVTVLEGTVYMGEGDEFDEAKAKEFGVGSFITMPIKSHHFAGSKTNSLIQLHGIGPWGITYINPKDDPRNNKSS